MPCCCPCPSSCTQCCSPSAYPAEVQVELSSNTVSVCYREGRFSGSTNYICTDTADFSIVGTFTLIKYDVAIHGNVSPFGAGYCVQYFFSGNCAADNFELSLWVGQKVGTSSEQCCPWDVKVSVTKRIGGGKYGGSLCGAGSATGKYYGASWNGPTATLTLDDSYCSGTGTATVSSDVGFDGDICGTVVAGDTYTCPDTNGCNNSDDPADCVPQNVDLEITLTV